MLNNESIPDHCIVVLVLRGLKSSFEKSKNKVYLMWNISHPQKVEDEEYHTFDHVFIASEIYAKTLKERVKVPVSALLQCTDPEIFKPTEVNLDYEGLFVGSSRNEYREIVKFAIESGVALTLFGNNWHKFIDKKYIKGDYINNGILNSVYTGAKFVLNNH